MPFCSDFWGFVVVSAMFGCFLSAWCALTPPAIVDMAGVDLLTSGFGTLTFVRGFAALIGEYSMVPNNSAARLLLFEIFSLPTRLSKFR